MALGLLVLKDIRAENAPKSFDIPGIVLLSGGDVLPDLGTHQGPRLGLGGQRHAGCSWAARWCCSWCSRFWETRSREPLIPLGLFRSVPLSAGTVLMVLMAFAFMGGLFFVTFYLQNVHGMSPVHAGVHLLPLTGMMIVASPAAGALIGQVGPRIPLVGGMLCTTVAMFGMSQLDPDHRHRRHVALVRPAGHGPRHR